jgi:hypothetical protein
MKRGYWVTWWTGSFYRARRTRGLEVSSSFVFLILRVVLIPTQDFHG